MHEERFDRIDQTLRDINQRFDGVDMRLDDIKNQMQVLHENAIDKIGAVAEYATIVEARMDRGFAEVKEAIAREVDPLKATVRRHSVDIDQLKNRGG
jgi:hypothetical protein